MAFCFIRDVRVVCLLFMLFQYEIRLSYVPSHRFQFGKLGEMIAARSRLKEHSRFLFVPGPDDAGTPKLSDAFS